MSQNTKTSTLKLFSSEDAKTAFSVTTFTDYVYLTYPSVLAAGTARTIRLDSPSIPEPDDTKTYDSTYKPISTLYSRTKGFVSTEEARALAAESALSSSLSTETKRASDAESVLTSALSTEVSDRQSAIAAEQSARIANVTTLTERINFITHNTDEKALDSLKEIVEKVNSVGTDVYARLSVIETYLAVLMGVDTIYPIVPSGFSSGTAPSNTQPADLVAPVV